MGILDSDPGVHGQSDTALYVRSAAGFQGLFWMRIMASGIPIRMHSRPTEIFVQSGSQEPREIHSNWPLEPVSTSQL
jgi:hypothetical protein